MCKCMRIGKSDIDLFAYKLKDDGKAMEFSKFEKDIGVVIDNRLTFENHINEKVNKANSVMGVIRRAFEFISAVVYSHGQTSYRIRESRVVSLFEKAY